MGHRNSGIGRGGDGGGHTGDLLKVHTAAGQELQLLPAAAEHEGIAALEPHHPMARPGLLQQNLVDLFLWYGMARGLLAHIDAPGAGRNQVQNGRTDQTVIHHHVGLLQGHFPLPGQ